MKRKFVEGGSICRTDQPCQEVLHHPTGLRTVEEPKDKIHTQEVDGKSYPNRSVLTTDTPDSAHRHPFTDSIIRVPLLDKWRGFNKTVMTVQPTLTSTWMCTPHT